jgi:hypothetical protein
MGYITYYRISSTPQLPNLLEVAKEIHCDVDVIDKGVVAFTAKWYDVEDDVLKLSLQYPNTLFIVKGFGEQKGGEDTWVMYTLNGQQEKFDAEIVFPQSTLKFPE